MDSISHILLQFLLWVNHHHVPRKHSIQTVKFIYECKAYVVFHLRQAVLNTTHTRNKDQSWSFNYKNYNYNNTFKIATIYPTPTVCQICYLGLYSSFWVTALELLKMHNFLETDETQGPGREVREVGTVRSRSCQHSTSSWERSNCSIVLSISLMIHDTNVKVMCIYHWIARSQYRSAIFC